VVLKLPVARLSAASITRRAVAVLLVFAHGIRAQTDANLEHILRVAPNSVRRTRVTMLSIITARGQDLGAEDNRKKNASLHFGRVLQDSITGAHGTLVWPSVAWAISQL